MSDLSNEELNALFAEKVCGLVVAHDDRRLFRTANGEPLHRFDKFFRPCDFITDANAVLPWLEKSRSQCTRSDSGLWRVTLEVENAQFETGVAPTFAKAAVLALLKAAGVDPSAPRRSPEPAD